MCCEEIKKAFKAEEKCFSTATSASEKRSQFLIELPKGSPEIFCRIAVDGCLIADDTVKKCDFVFRRCSNSDLYFVELKGTRIEVAFEQILATLVHFKSKITLEKSKVFGFIVSSRVRPQQRQSVRNFKKAFEEHHGAKLRIESTKIILKPQPMV
jgi:hypothetical protein